MSKDHSATYPSIVNQLHILNDTLQKFWTVQWSLKYTWKDVIYSSSVGMVFGKLYEEKNASTAELPSLK